MSSMDKMWASLVAMGLMVVACLLITYARTRMTGVWRGVVSFIAFILFIPIIILMLLSMF